MIRWLKGDQKPRDFKSTLISDTIILSVMLIFGAINVGLGIWGVFQLPILSILFILWGIGLYLTGVKAFNRAFSVYRMWFIAKINPEAMSVSASQTAMEHIKKVQDAETRARIVQAMKGMTSLSTISESTLAQWLCQQKNAWEITKQVHTILNLITEEEFREKGNE